MKHATIAHISYYLPEGILTNDTLAELYPEWPAERIFEKTGIRERRIAAEGETAGDLAFHAAQKLFAESGTTPTDIDFVLLGTQSPDYILPTTACILQDRLGIPVSAGAMDFSLGCSAYVYGLALSKALIAGGMAKNVLFLTSETISKFIHPMDKTTRTLLGDGAAATLVQASAEDDIQHFVFGTDGSGQEMLIVPAGGMREPADLPSLDPEVPKSRSHLIMNGPDVFSFALSSVPNAIQEVLKKNTISMDDVDLFVFHQANNFMLEALRKALKVPRKKFYVDMEDVGNTASASIPIALVRAMAKGVLKSGMNVVLAGFGVGLSWGATVVKWKIENGKIL